MDDYWSKSYKVIKFDIRPSYEALKNGVHDKIYIRNGIWPEMY